MIFRHFIHGSINFCLLAIFDVLWLCFKFYRYMRNAGLTADNKLVSCMWTHIQKYSQVIKMENILLKNGMISNLYKWMMDKEVFHVRKKNFLNKNWAFIKLKWWIKAWNLWINFCGISFDRKSMFLCTVSIEDKSKYWNYSMFNSRMEFFKVFYFTKAS